MKQYLTSSDAVVDLHEKGFTNDFQLCGNDLLWVQERIFIRAGEFAILEYHKIANDTEDMDKEIVFGIIAPWHHAKGILLNHNKQNTKTTPPILLRKMNEFNLSVSIQSPKISDDIDCGELPGIFQ